MSHRHQEILMSMCELKTEGLLSAFTYIQLIVKFVQKFDQFILNNYFSQSLHQAFSSQDFFSRVSFCLSGKYFDAANSLKLIASSPGSRAWNMKSHLGLAATFPGLIKSRGLDNF